jgi:serine phosphatase RsbU (regulator of sigma subunit)
MSSANFLSKIPVFSDLPEHELEHLQHTLEVKHLEAGEILFREGEPGERFYVLMEGELEILLGVGTKDELLLNMLGPGEYLGEMSLVLPGGERTATARAKQKAVLLSMSRDEFTVLLEQHPVLVKSLVRVLSERLDSTNDATYRDLTAKNRQLQKAYDELKAAQEQLIEKERLERELQVAADIQLSILPDVLPEPPRFDFGARIDPARQVGGDFYDVLRLERNKIAILIGDVADKGVPSAIFMARAHALIAAEAETYDNPGDVLRKANEHITRLEKSTQFVTVLYGILNVDTGQFTYARAGHEPPLLLKPDGSVERMPHDTGMALGLWEKITLDERTITLPAGSTLVLYTDGMTDCRAPNGEPFGLARIQRSLDTCINSSAQTVCDHLLQRLKDFQQGSKQDDDVTLVAVHAKERRLTPRPEGTRDSTSR